MNGIFIAGLIMLGCGLAITGAFVVAFLAGSRDRMPESLDVPTAPYLPVRAFQSAHPARTEPVPWGRIFQPAPIPPVIRAEGYPIGARLGFTRTAMEPTPLEPAWIYEDLRTEWAALVYAREAALRDPTQEFAALMGVTWTAAELETLAALELPCSHCGVDLDHRADYPANHRACPGCACGCTLVGVA